MKFLGKILRSIVKGKTISQDTSTLELLLRRLLEGRDFSSLIGGKYRESNPILKSS